MVGTETHIRLVNRELNDELKRFVKLPLKDYIVVKGQTIASIYPNPLVRMAGDIDFPTEGYCVRGNAF